MKNAVTFLLIAVLALGCGLTVGAQRGGSDVPEAAEMAVQPGRMPGVIARYSVDRFSLYRSSPVEKSPARQIRLRQYYTEWLGALGRMDFDTMGQDDKVDFLLLKNHLDHELSDLDFEARTVAEAAALAPFGQTITDLEGARRHMEPIDPAKVAAALTGLNKQIETNRKAIEAGLKKDTKTDSTTDGKTDNKPDGNDAAKVDPIKATEVRRSFSGTDNYGPLYQAAYLLGGLQLRALQRELVGSGRMTHRAFHDAVLKENRIPIEMLRAILTRQPLARDFVTTWKFYGPISSER